MYTFHEYYLSEAISLPDAMTILGIDPDEDIDQEKVKKAYRSASMKAHPDRGGSDADMQKVNAAYAKLKDIQSTSVQGGRDTYADERAMSESYLQMLDVGAYTGYLSKLFGVPLESNSELSISKYGAGRRVIFSSKDRETVITLNLSFMYHNFKRTKSLGSGDQGKLIPANLHVHVEILHNRQKMKIARRDFSATNDSSVFEDASVVFPADKIKKKVDLSARTGDNDGDVAKKMKKRDFQTTLKNKFSDGYMSGDTFVLPIGDRMSVEGTRITMMRQGTWQFKVFPGKVEGDNYMPTLPETDKSLDFILNLCAEMLATRRPELTWARYVDKMEDREAWEALWPKK